MSLYRHYKGNLYRVLYPLARHTETEEAFVRMREARDRELPMPKLILPSLQVNIRGGRLPEPEANGKRYLKIPLNALDGAVWGE